MLRVNSAQNYGASDTSENGVVMVPHTEAEISQMHVVKTVEAMLRGLLEKAQHASEVIASLRSDNTQLCERVEVLEREVADLQRELSAREEELQRKETQGGQSTADGFLTPQEKELMREKLRDLLARISQYV